MWRSRRKLFQLEHLVSLMCFVARCIVDIYGISFWNIVVPSVSKVFEMMLFPRTFSRLTMFLAVVQRGCSVDGLNVSVGVT